CCTPCRNRNAPSEYTSGDTNDGNPRGEIYLIDLYFWPTGNGKNITIMLEETGLRYRIIPVNINKGDQFKPEFLEISPNNKMPDIVDHGNGLAIFESGAILQYLAEKAGKLLPG